MTKVLAEKDDSLLYIVNRYPDVRRLPVPVGSLLISTERLLAKLGSLPTELRSLLIFRCILCANDFKVLVKHIQFTIVTQNPKIISAVFIKIFIVFKRHHLY